MKKRLLITVGPIPSKIDSVKYITNKFKGGLGIKTAEALRDEFDVTVVRAQIAHWLKTDLPTIVIDDVNEYFKVVTEFGADVFVLAGAVANLGPIEPFKGKFPSHLYQEGDEFDLRFKIEARSIDRIKKLYGRSTLIGYKLYDGTDEELMDAGWATLVHSRANVVFCNQPNTAKISKIALMPDGTHIRMSFDEHIDYIRRVINLQWYRTEIDKRKHTFTIHDEAKLGLLLRMIAVQKGEYSFGTVAFKKDHGILTTTRGKREDGICYVHNVDHETRTVYASAKATMNAPTLFKLFTRFPSIKFILHGHRQLAGLSTYPYAFSGTTEETNMIDKNANSNFPSSIFNVQNHGYYACFETYEQVMKWIDENYPR